MSIKNADMTFSIAFSLNLKFFFTSRGAIFKMSLQFFRLIKLFDLSRGRLIRSSLLYVKYSRSMENEKRFEIGGVQFK